MHGSTLCWAVGNNTHLWTHFWRQNLDVKLWVMAKGLEPPQMLVVSMGGNLRLAKWLGNEVAGFLVVPHFLECNQVDELVHPTLLGPWWPVLFALALSMVFAMALSMVFAMALANSGVTWCHCLNKTDWLWHKNWDSGNSANWVMYQPWHLVQLQKGWRFWCPDGTWDATIG